MRPARAKKVAAKEAPVVGDGVVPAVVGAGMVETVGDREAIGEDMAAVAAVREVNEVRKEVAAAADATDEEPGVEFS